MAFFDLSIEALQQYRPEVREPADFDDFWSRTLAEQPFRPELVELRDVETAYAGITVQDMVFPGYDDAPIAAWVISPTTPGPHPTVVEFVGYGGGRGLVEEHFMWALAGFVNVVMDTRGQGARWGGGGQTPDPGPAAGPAVQGCMTRGIESPDSYYYRRVHVDAVHALEAAAELTQVDASRIVALGHSQGGGIAIAASALSDRPVALMADEPFLCHFERAIGLTGVDPYDEIARYLAIHREHIERTYDTLSYFDNVNMAKRISVPALFSTGLMDTTCPPSTVFAMRNHYAGPSEIKAYRFNNHEGGGVQHQHQQVLWLKELMASLG